MHTIWLKVYELFMMAIDAIDNGISQWDTKDTPPRYLVKTDLSSRVGNLNPRWDEEDPPEVYDRQFQKAVELTGAEFSDALNYYAKSWLPARQCGYPPWPGHARKYALLCSSMVSWELFLSTLARGCLSYRAFRCLV